MVIVLLAMTMIRMTAPVSQEQVPEANIKNYTQLLDSAEAGDLVSVEITTYENTQSVDGKLADGTEFTGVIIPRENADTVLKVFRENEHNIAVFAYGWSVVLFHAAEPRRWGQGHAVWQEQGQSYLR